MIYIYDIVLNFNKDFYEFFEWKKNDKIINAKKIPAFKISKKALLDFKFNNVKISKNFLDKIYNNSSIYGKSHYNYICLFSDCYETIGVMFDIDGNITKRSSLIFDEDEEVNEEIESEDVEVIDYRVLSTSDYNFVTRIDKEKISYLNKFINSLDLNSDVLILKYLYYDLFEKDCDKAKIKKNLLDSIPNCYLKMYEIVKLFNKIKN